MVRGDECRKYIAVFKGQYFFGLLVQKPVSTETGVSFCQEYFSEDKRVQWFDQRFVQFTFEFTQRFHGSSDPHFGDQFSK